MYIQSYFFHFSREEHSHKLSSGPPGFGFRTCMAYSASGYKTRLNRSQDLGVLEMCWCRGNWLRWQRYEFLAPMNYICAGSATQPFSIRWTIFRNHTQFHPFHRFHQIVQFLQLHQTWFYVFALCITIDRTSWLGTLTRPTTPEWFVRTGEHWSEVPQE